MKNFKKNLLLLYLRQISAGLLIYQPIFFPYLQSKGLNAQDFSLLIVAYNIGTLMLVVPAARFADTVGRKWALFFANTIYSFATLLLALGNSFFVFVIAEIFYSLAVSLDLSTHSSFLFEFLKVSGKQDQYYRYDAIGMFLFLFFSATGNLIGGFIAEKFSLQAPLLITSVLTAIGIICAFFLEEPKIKEQSSSFSNNHFESENDKNKENIVLKIIKKILSSSGLKWALLLNMVFIFSRQFVNLYLPGPYFRFLELKISTFGKFAALLTFIAGIIALFSRRFVQKQDLRWLTLFGLFLIPLGYFLMGILPNITHNKNFGLFGFFLFSIPLGLAATTSFSLLNRQFDDSKNRTTFLSIVDFCTRVFSSILTFSFGKITAMAFGIQGGLILIAILFTLFFIILLPGIFKFAK
jgi:MFS family permease